MLSRRFAKQPTVTPCVHDLCNAFYDLVSTKWYLPETTGAAGAAGGGVQGDPRSYFRDLSIEGTTLFAIWEDSISDRVAGVRQAACDVLADLIPTLSNNFACSCMMPVSRVWGGRGVKRSWNVNFAQLFVSGLGSDVS